MVLERAVRSMSTPSAGDDEVPFLESLPGVASVLESLPGAEAVSALEPSSDDGVTESDACGSEAWSETFWAASFLLFSASMPDFNTSFTLALEPDFFKP